MSSDTTAYARSVHVCFRPWLAVYSHICAWCSPEVVLGTTQCMNNVNNISNNAAS